MGKDQRQDPEPAKEDLTIFLAPLQALQYLLESFHNKGVIVGGIAASLLGVPRFTADLDAVFILENEEIPELMELASRFGIEPRISDAEIFARKSRVLLMRHTASGVDIDLLMGMLPFEAEMVERSKIFETGAIKLRLPSPEDLIIMKAVAHRPKDMADIQAVAENTPDLDIERIQYWVEQFAVALDQPELWVSIEQWLR